MHDLVIRGGTVVDGTGAPPFVADVAVVGDRIVEVGAVSGTARRTIEADGAFVTPGWVDIHTHYDGQVTWDAMVEPSSRHGVTSVVMGNCGVGFAPAHTGADAHDFLISLMEGVAVLREVFDGAALFAADVPGLAARLGEALDVPDAARVARGTALARRHTWESAAVAHERFYAALPA